MMDVSSEEMAEMMDISVGHYLKLERGEHAMSLACLQVLHEQFGIDLNYMITGRSREEDIARDLIYSKPEEIFYYMHQLLTSCEQAYQAIHQKQEVGSDELY